MSTGNLLLLVVYLCGIPIAAVIDISVDPPPEREDDSGRPLSAGWAGGQILGVAAFWPLVLVGLALVGFCRLLGRIGGVR